MMWYALRTNMVVQNNPTTHVLIMAGGKGTRFWPKSRSNRPKQLLALWDEKTLIEHTVDRFLNLIPPHQIWIVTTKDVLGLTQEVLKRYEGIHYLAEPQGKNTAACILWGALEIQKQDPQATIAVMPSDHYIKDESAFLKLIQYADETAHITQKIITLGIEPLRPETGYGYIEVQKTRSSFKVEALPVLRFIEKPDLSAAKQYLESKNYFWNAGMFVFTIQTGLNAYEKHMPNLFKLFSKAIPIEKTYLEISKEDSISFDYGIMEKLSKDRVLVVPANCCWSDVGSFTALEELSLVEPKNVIQMNSSSNFVLADRGIVTLLGVEGLIIVRDGDVVLVASKNQAQDIKPLLEEVKKQHPKLV